MSHAWTRRRPTRRTRLLAGRLPVVIGAVIGLAGCLAAAGCGSGTAGGARTPAATPARGHASIGSLRLTGAYLPEPAAPSVAAGYFSVRNTGSKADTLVKVTSRLTDDARVHRYVTGSGGAEQMVPVKGGLHIPAHQTVTLRPGGMHLMLMNPRRQLHKGQRVTLRVTFARAGTVSISVPVVARGGMSDMPSGMPMS